MNRILNILNKEFGNVNQAAFILASFAFLSQILGLLRDRSLAHFLGPSSDLDIYYTAFRVPDFIFVSVASLAAVTALLPFLEEKLEGKHDSTPQARKFFNDTFTVFLVTMIIVSIIVFFLMPVFASLIAPGFSLEEQDTLIKISRIMLLSPILLGLSNLIGSITQLFRKFLIFALSPVFYVIGILIGVLIFYPLFGLTGLALGVVLGALLHFLIQLPISARHRFLPRFSFTIDFKEIKKLLLLSLPRTLGLSFNSLAIIAIIALASLISEGSISVFNFSFNLKGVPLTLIGVSYSVAAFPTLARLFSGNDMVNFVRQISTAAKQIIFFSLPIVFLFIVLRAQIVRVILGSGSFTWDDTRLTAASLALFSISITAHALMLLFVRGYYAAGKTRRPVLINLFSSILIVVFAYGFLRLFNTVPMIRYFIESLFRVEDIPGTGILMLSFAYSLGTIINFLLLWRAFKKDFLTQVKIPLLKKTFFQIFSASFFMAYVTYQFLVIFGDVFDLNRFWGVFLQGFLSGIIGIIVGIIILKLMKNEQLEEVWQTLRSRFWKTKQITVPGQEDL